MIHDVQLADWEKILTGAPTAPKEEAVLANQVANRIDTSPNNVSKGLLQLVLTLVELIRDLMERQALRRIENGTLSEQEIEQIGTTFLLLQEKMQELKDFFGFTDEDLNLDLGPLGKLR